MYDERYTTSTIAAARARQPRRAPKAKSAPGGVPPLDFPRNNYLAEPRRKAGLPAEARRAKAGAIPGNRNAQRHGRYAAQTLALRAATRTVCRKLAEMAAVISAMADAGVDPDRHLVLL